MASCAACLQPILRAERFVLDGTEVFHAACLGQAYRSKLRRAEQCNRELESQLADTRRSAARVEAETNRLRNDATSRAAAACVLEGRVSGLQAQLELAQERLQVAHGELQGARNQNAALRTELSALRSSETEGQKSENADLDATSLRFRLLELD
jgi:chromosome segregation ATPase